MGIRMRAREEKVTSHREPVPTYSPKHRGMLLPSRNRGRNLFHYQTRAAPCHHHRLHSWLHRVLWPVYLLPA